jgi:hypothetical protein
VDRGLSARLGQPQGTIALWVLGFIAAGTFYTAAARTVWISQRLRERDRAA